MMIGLTLAVLASCQDATTWEAQAREFAFRGDFDRELIARIQALSAEESEQERRELARLANWCQRLLVTVRHPVPTGEDWVRSVAVSADGQRLATAGSEVWVWDSHTGAAVATPIPLEIGADEVALDPCGTRAAVIEDWRQLTVWDVATGKLLLGPIIGERGAHSCLAWGPQGRVLASGQWYESATVRLWDIDAGALRFETPPFDDSIFDIEISPDGRFVAAGGQFAGAGIWRVADGGLVGYPIRPQTNEEEFGTNEVRALRFHPSEPWIGIADPRVVRTWDLESGNYRAPIGCSGEYAEDLAFDAVRRRWVVADREWTYASAEADGRPAGRPLVPDDLDDRWREKYSACPVALSPNGTRFANAGIWDTVRVWDTTSGERLTPVISHGSVVEHVTFTHDDRLVTASHNGVVRIWSTERRTPSPTPVDEYATSVHLAPGRRYGLLLSERNVVQVLDSDGRSRDLDADGAHLDTIAVSASGDRLVGGGSEGKVWAWDLASGKVVGEPMQQEDWVRHLALDADGRHLAVDVGHVHRIWDIDQGFIFGQTMSAGTSELAFDSTGNLWCGGEWLVAQVEGVDLQNVANDTEGWLQLAADASGHLAGRDERVEWVDHHGDRFRVDDLVDVSVDSWLACAGRAVALHEEHASLIDPFAGRLVTQLDHGQLVEGARAAGDRLVTWGEGRLDLWRLEDGARRARLPYEHEILDAVPIPGTDRIAVTSERHTLTPIDVLSGMPTGGTREYARKLQWVGFAGPQTALLVTGSGEVLTLDLATGESRTLLQREGARVYYLDLSSDGRRLAYVSEPSDVELIDVELGQVLYRKTLEGTLRRGSRRMSRQDQAPIQFDPTGTRLLIAATTERSIGSGVRRSVFNRPVLVDAILGEELCELTASPGLVESAAFDATGERLATWRRSDDLRTWDTATGERLAAASLGERISQVRFQPGGKLISVLGAKGRFAAWEVDTGLAHVGPTKYLNSYRAGAMSADGRQFYLLDEENVGLLVDLRAGRAPFRHLDSPGLVFGPEDLALLGVQHLARIADGGFVPIASRRFLPSTGMWEHLGQGDSWGLINDTHAVVGARPTPNGAALIVLDFGPTRDEPLPGAPASLLEEWSRRLGLAVTSDGAIVERR